MAKLIFLLKIITERIIFSIILKVKRALKIPVKPVFINFIATYRCNSHCLMCHIWQKYKNDKKMLENELSLAQIKQFLEENRKMLGGLKHIGLTGGEAFLRPDIVPLVKLLHQSLPQARIGLQTNGLSPKLIEKKLKQIKLFYPNVTLAVSLDGLGLTHDKIRGVPQAFAKFKQTLKIIKKLKIKDVTLGMTICKYNYKQIKNVWKLAEKYGLEFSCFLPEISDYYFGNKLNKQPALKLNTSIKKSLGKSLMAFRYHYYMDNLRRRLEKNKARTLPCYSGYTSIVIDPYGNVRPCLLRNEVFGNLKNKPLKEILFDKHAWKIRKKLESCSCWTECEVSTSAVVDVFDVLFWFISSAEKKEFLRQLIKKLHRF